MNDELTLFIFVSILVGFLLGRISVIVFEMESRLWKAKKLWFSTLTDDIIEISNIIPSSNGETYYIEYLFDGHAIGITEVDKAFFDKFRPELNKKYWMTGGGWFLIPNNSI